MRTKHDLGNGWHLKMYDDGSATVSGENGVSVFLPTESVDRLRAIYAEAKATFPA